jgi:hypothetical protein
VVAVGSTKVAGKMMPSAGGSWWTSSFSDSSVFLTFFYETLFCPWCQSSAAVLLLRAENCEQIEM